MTKRSITLTDVRKWMATGRPFSIVLCTLDAARGTGGERIAIEGACLVQSEVRSIRAKRGQVAASIANPTDTRNPHHLMHGTFNMRLRNSDIMKAHWVLIEEFNHQQVTL